MPILIGGKFNDTLTGASSGDKLWGNSGDNTLKGGAGDDQIVTSSGTDYAYGGSGNDNINGYLNSDGTYVYWASSGTQWLYGGEGNDTIFGGTGVDDILGEAGKDYLDGLEGNDTLSGGPGIDWMQGGEGDDSYFIDDLWDHVYDTSGSDTIHVSADYYNTQSTIENIQYRDSVKTLPYWIDVLLDDFSSAYHLHYIEGNKTFKYIFPQQTLSYFTSNDLRGWSPAGPSIEKAFVNITSLLSHLIDVNFVQTDDAYQVNTIAVSKNSQKKSNAYAASPEYKRVYDSFISSDIFISESRADPFITSPNFDLEAIVHELGHSLGLKHTFSTLDRFGNRPQAPYLTSSQEDNNQWTSMSYTRDAQYYSAHFRPLDLSALQYLYGVSTSANAGDTTFTFSKNEGTFVYDGQGIDTIDATSATSAATIYLTHGDWSYIGVKSDLITAGNQLTINFNTVIEAIKGGSFNDSLFGNDIDNTMDGNGGDDAIFGYLGNDTLRGGFGEDSLYGNEGDDSIYARYGSDSIYGGSGIDIVIYESTINKHIIVNTDSTNWTINELENTSIDTLKNIERVRFSDKTVALDISVGAVGGSCYRMYKAAFNRTPDEGGLGYWIGQMDLGKTLMEVSAGFIDSDEFRASYGTNPTNGEFLTKVYNNVLGRDPDSGGYDWWVDQLANNPEKSWSKVMADFSEGTENQANVLELIGNGVQYDLWVA